MDSLKAASNVINTSFNDLHFLSPLKSLMIPANEGGIFCPPPPFPLPSKAFSLKGSNWWCWCWDGELVDGDNPGGIFSGGGAEKRDSGDGNIIPPSSLAL